MDEGQQPGFKVVRMITLSLIASSIMLLAITWLLVEQGGPAGDADGALTPILALSIWAGVTLLWLASGLLFRGKALAVVDEAQDVQDPERANEALGRLQTNLIIAAALVDSSALLAAVFYLLTGSGYILIGGVAALCVGGLTVFPRREWFEPLERIRAGAVLPGLIP